jgi:2'-5' RNA ligase
MVHYFIEFRFQGKAKYEMKRMIYDIDRKFHLKHAKIKRPIPHVTIIAPFYTNKQKQLVSDFNNICKKHSLIKFKINGYGCFDNSKVVYINIKPSNELIQFRKELIKQIKKYSTLKDYDSKDNYKPHATLAMKLNNVQFNKIKNYVLKNRGVSKDYSMVRTTLIKGNKILYEYDFLLRRLLNRREAKSKIIYSKTISKLRGEIDQHKKKSIKKEGIITKIKMWLGIR